MYLSIFTGKLNLLIVKILQLSLMMVVCLISSCSKDSEQPQPVSKIMLNVSYGPDPSQKMDVYLPANNSTTSTKVIIMIHGGGWTTGDKSAITPYVDSLKRRLTDYAVFNINYRLSAFPINIFPAQELDVKTAIEHIYNKRNEYGISEKFVLIGESAGAHLAMLHAYKYNAPVKIKSVASLFGPADLVDMYNNPVNGNINISQALALAIGKTPLQDPALYTNSSPVNFITPALGVPTILLHGGLDELVSPAQSVNVRNKLVNAGIASQLVLYPTKAHGYDWDSITFFDAFNKIQAFLTVNVP